MHRHGRERGPLAAPDRGGTSAHTSSAEGVAATSSSGSGYCPDSRPDASARRGDVTGGTSFVGSRTCIHYAQLRMASTDGRHSTCMAGRPFAAWTAHMPRRRLDWTWNDEDQEFTTPAGTRVRLVDIAGMIQAHAECRHDFAGPWAGWKMRGAALIPPHGTPKGTRITPTNAGAFARWVTGATSAPVPDSAPADRPAPLPALPQRRDGRECRACTAARTTRLGQAEPAPQVVQLADYQQRLGRAR